MKNIKINVEGHRFLDNGAPEDYLKRLFPTVLPEES